MQFNRSIIARLGAVAVAFAALAGASVAQARSDVFFSVGANVAPGVVVGASNYGAYPVYGYPVAAPVYAPAPVYVEPAPVYYGYSPTVVVSSGYYGPRYYGPRYYGPHRVVHVRHWH